jgi:hypothetical protein
VMLPHAARIPFKRKGGRLERGRGVNGSVYSPSFAPLFSRNRLPSRMYRLTPMALENPTTPHRGALLNRNI